jgi:cobalt-zinc-cadmium efflux system membrane fusion protein
MTPRYFLSCPRFVQPLSLLLGVSLFLSGCGASVKVPEVPSEAHLPARTIPLLTLTAQQERDMQLAFLPVHAVVLPEVVETTGQVQAATDRMSHVYAPIAGMVTAIYVHMGQPVRAGQVLARLKSDEIGQIQVDLLQQTLQSASDLKQAMAQEQLSRANWLRENQLYTQGVSARADMELAQTQYRKDQLTVQSLRERYQAAISLAQARMSVFGVPAGTTAAVIRQRKIIPYIILTAPENGVVISRNINTGELAAPEKELFTLADLQTVWLVGNIYEQDVSRIHIGQSAQMRLESLPGRIYSGEVNYVDSMIDPQTRTMQVRITASNLGLQLKPNMFARLAIKTGVRNVLAVPLTAIQHNGDFTLVYVQTAPHQYEERRITTGQDDGQNIEVQSGLNVGETIVSRNTFPLKGEFLKLAAKANE